MRRPNNAETKVNALGSGKSGMDRTVNKRKLAKVSAIAAIGIFAIYQFITPPLTYKIDSRLIEINDTLKALSEEYGFEFLKVYSSRTYPVEFSDAIPSDVYAAIRKSNIYVIYFYNGPDRQSADFIVDRFFFPRWYYQYSDNGLTEEEIVPSVEDAVKQQDGPPYFFCQKAEVLNWFFCAQDSGG